MKATFHTIGNKAGAALNSNCKPLPCHGDVLLRIANEED